ncbi:SDR family oxidoreductase [Arthrobacter sp.]|uniref:SDR family oxidoreductase n=1 Tax=Arthrobacter sp. TaxID=1667 RepID=UPI0026DFA033|nr:SDR family oxidoreductase [Arthrobacter sp.]MDO5753622.1 SDR family oxidoreductase [Arthrobacter sp.]
MTDSSLAAPLVLVAGGSSAAGIAVARELLSTGMRVLTVGSDAGRITAAAESAGGAVPLVCDLADPEAVRELAEKIHTDFGPLDGLIHLVGGWRGGTGITGQIDADWDFLHTLGMTTLRNTSREFYDDLAASPVGRLAIVSSTAVTAPTADNANYASVKAAAESWVQSVAQGFGSQAGSSSAAVVLVVKALVDPAMRERSPERRFPGFTDAAELGRSAAGLFARPASELNGARLILDQLPKKQGEQ